MRRLARLLRQQGIGSVTELSQTKLQACAPLHRLDDHRLAASVRLLERYFESETSMYPAQPLNRTQQRVAAYAIYIWIRYVGWRRPPSPPTVRRPPRC
jgi:hypothetical protein